MEDGISPLPVPEGGGATLLITGDLESFHQFPAARRLYASAGVACRFKTNASTDATLIPLWENEQQAEALRSEVESFSTKIVNELVPILNAQHALTHSCRFWTLLLTPWLHHFLSVVMDRAHMVAQARAIDANTVVLGPQEPDVGVIIDTLDFAKRAYGDFLNFEICAFIAQMEGLPVLRVAAGRPCSGAVKLVPPRKLGTWLTEVSRAFWWRGDVFAKQSYLDWASSIKLFLLSRGRFVPIHPPLMSFEHGGADIELRKSLFFEVAGKFDKEIGWRRMAILLLRRYFPLSYLEGFASLRRFSLKSYPRDPKAILTANALYYDEAFKDWVGRSVEGGSLLIGVQHGGNFRIQKYLLGREFELGIVDAYLQWGCVRETYTAEAVKSGPILASVTPPQMVRRSARRMPKTRLLYSMTARPRYCAYLHPLFHPAEYVKHIVWQNRILKGLGENLSKSLFIRLHADDLGWEIKRNLAAFPNCQFDSLENTFQQSLDSTRLHLTDNLGTTYCESLARNIPTVICIDPLTHPLDAAAARIFDNLERAEVVFHDPQLATKHLNRIWPNADDWWQSPKVRRAVDDFCDNYASISNAPIIEWRSAIYGVLSRLRSPGYQ